LALISGKWRSFAKPSVMLPVLLASALLFLVFKLGDLRRFIGRIEQIPLEIVLISLAMAIVYLAFKGLQLHLLLVNLGVRPGWRRFALSYAVGEMLVTLPLGIFSQNWILSSTGRSRFGTNSAATVLMLLAETLVVLVFLAVVSVPGWPEIRAIAALFAVGLVATVCLAVRFRDRARAWTAKTHRPQLRRALRGGIRTIDGVNRLSDWRLLAVNVVVTTIYLGALAFAMREVGFGVGIEQMDYVKAATIYSLALGVVLVGAGFVPHIGTVEVIGMNMASAWGLSVADGFALMLGFRLLWTGSIWLLTLPIVVSLWRSTLRSKADRNQSSRSRKRRTES
jgi:hypothetical protein